jgi:acyl-CoA synthetase (AMP-forming)/AMP-acid ligase II
VCDIACALAECVSVGLHTTYSTKSAYAAMKTADISLLLCSSDIVYSKSATTDSSTGGTGGKGLERGGSAGYSGSHSFWTVEDVLQLHRSTPPVIGDTSAANGHSEGRLLQHVVVMDSSETAFSLSHPREGQGEGQGQIFEVYGSKAAGEGMFDTFNPHISYLVDAVRAATDTHTHTYTHTNSSVELDDSKSRGDSTHEERSAATSQTVPSSSLPPHESPLELSELLEGRGSIFTLLFTSGSTGEPKAVVRTDCDCIVYFDCAGVESADRMMMMTCV